MTRPETRYHHGDEVLVLDRKGEVEARGRIVGVHRSNPTRYDIMPRGETSLKAALLGIVESRVVAVSAPHLAYERPELGEPRHILDDA